MIGTLMDLLFACRHKRLTRPITPVRKRGLSGAAYVACLDCGKQLSYDTENMKVGKPVPARLQTGECRPFEAQY